MQLALTGAHAACCTCSLHVLLVVPTSDMEPNTVLPTDYWVLMLKPSKNVEIICMLQLRSMSKLLTSSVLMFRMYPSGVVCTV